MPTYRVYFRQQHRVIGRDDFTAENDATAFSIAHEIWSSARDICDWFEVWHGKQLVRRHQNARAASTAMQQSIEAAAAEREIALKESHWKLATSRQLLQRLEKLRPAARMSANRRMVSVNEPV